MPVPGTGESTHRAIDVLRFRLGPSTAQLAQLVRHYGADVHPAVSRRPQVAGSLVRILGGCGVSAPHWLGLVATGSSSSMDLTKFLLQQSMAVAEALLGLAALVALILLLLSLFWSRRQKRTKYFEGKGNRPSWAVVSTVPLLESPNSAPPSGGASKGNLALPSRRR